MYISLPRLAPTMPKLTTKRRWTSYMLNHNVEAKLLDKLDMGHLWPFSWSGAALTHGF